MAVMTSLLGHNGRRKTIIILVGILLILRKEAMFFSDGRFAGHNSRECYTLNVLLVLVYFIPL